MAGSHFEFIKETGEWRNNLLQCSTLFFNELFWESMINELHKTFSTAADVFFFNGGVGIGKHVGIKAVESGREPSSFKEFLDLAFKAGWGRFELDYDNSEAGAPVVKMTTDNNFFCTLCTKNDHQHYCPLIRGVMTGLFTVLTGKQYSCERINCQQESDPTSVFKMTSK